MISENMVLVSGNLTKDSARQGDHDIVAFSIAHNENFKDSSGAWKQNVSYFDVTVFGKLCQKALGLKRGDAVYVQGRLKQERWLGQDGGNRSAVKITAFSIKTDPKPRVYEEDVAPPEPAKSSSPTPDDDLPF